MAKKGKPKKDAENLRVHSQVVAKLRKVHPRHIAKSREVSSFVDFTETVIEAGLVAIIKSSKKPD